MISEKVFYLCDMEMKKFLGFDRVLCLSPHPDDVELSMSGTIFKYKGTRFDVLTLTKGGAKGYDSTNNIDRRDEVSEFWKKATSIGATNVDVIFSNVDYFEDKDGDAGWVNYLDRFVDIKLDDNQTHYYDCLFVPSFEDSMYEHQFVNNLGFALIRNSPISLVEYGTVSATNEWSPNLFVDVMDVFEEKEMCLDSFVSQKKKSYFNDWVRAKMHSNYQCSKRGVSIVESYKIKEIITR